MNNAGLFTLAPIVEISREDYRRIYAVNVEGLLFTMQAAARQMIASAGSHGFSLAILLRFLVELSRDSCVDIRSLAWGRGGNRMS